MAAPVNTGDFWITEEEPPAANACLDDDFAICPLGAIYVGTDEYYLHGGIFPYGENRILIGGDSDSWGQKIENDPSTRTRVLKEYDTSGNLIGTILDGTEYDTLWNTYICSFIYGAPKMFLSLACGPPPYDSPQHPTYFWNFEDNPIESDLYYVLLDIDGAIDRTTSGPGIAKNGKLFTIAGAALDTYRVVRYDIPKGGIDNSKISVYGERYVSIEAVSTDPLLANLGGYGTIIESDEGRMFVFIGANGESNAKHLVEFDEDLNVLRSWDFSGESQAIIRASLGGAMTPIPIAAGRISFPAGASTDRNLYELSDDGTFEIVHVWTSAWPNWDGVRGSPGWAALGSEMPGIVGANHRYGYLDTPRTHLINFNGTPDYP